MIYTDSTRTGYQTVDFAMLENIRIVYEIATLSEDERTMAVRLTQEMNECEAETLAIAVKRSITLLTDDPALDRVARDIKMNPVTSLDLLADWNAREDLEYRVLYNAARSMKERANFTPMRGHHLRAWYSSLSNDTASELREKRNDDARFF